MSRVRSRNAYQHDSDFDKSHIVAYLDCSLSYRSIAALGPCREPSIKNWDRLQDNKCLLEQFDDVCNSMDTQLGDHVCGYP
ncbi:hypothetical protein TNCV_4578131 [Trichonephila clavipes]|nr:hypothetical protein TNCV_4578131 [Trichonephila clavipes]